MMVPWQGPKPNRFGGAVAEANQSAPTKMKYNWKIPVRDFLRTAHKHGLRPVAVNNGGGWQYTPTAALAVAEIDATDESHVHFEHTDGKRVIAFLVLGNEPAELVADYSTHPAIDAATEEHYNNWEGKPCPTTES